MHFKFHCELCVSVVKDVTFEILLLFQMEISHEASSFLSFLHEVFISKAISLIIGRSLTSERYQKATNSEKQFFSTLPELIFYFNALHWVTNCASFNTSTA